jgi:hypothetical protein
MANPEKLATLSTHDDDKQNTTQHRKLKGATRTPSETGVEPMCW